MNSTEKPSENIIHNWPNFSFSKLSGVECSAYLLLKSGHKFTPYFIGERERERYTIEILRKRDTP